MDIPKTRQYDTGKIEVIARSSVGETLAVADLRVVPRSDDYRNVLKNSPRRKYLQIAIAHTWYMGSMKQKHLMQTNSIITLNKIK